MFKKLNDEGIKWLEIRRKHPESIIISLGIFHAIPRNISQKEII